MELARKIDYNCFVWPEADASVREAITGTARKILEARENHPECTLAALYDDTSMPADLRQAHRENDAAVCGAYGWDEETGELEMVSRLFGMYEKLCAEG